MATIKNYEADVSSVSFKTLYDGQFTSSTRLIILRDPVILSHRCSITVSLEPYPLRHRSFYQFTREIDHAACCENNRKVCTSELEVIDLLFFSNGFPTSGDVYYAGKPLENAVCYFNKSPGY